MCSLYLPPFKAGAAAAGAATGIGGCGAAAATCTGLDVLALPDAMDVVSDQLDVAGGGEVDAVVTLAGLSGAGGGDDDPLLNRLEKKPPMPPPDDVTGAAGCACSSIGAADKAGAGALGLEMVDCDSDATDSACEAAGAITTGDAAGGPVKASPTTVAVATDCKPVSTGCAALRRALAASRAASLSGDWRVI